MIYSEVLNSVKPEFSPIESPHQYKLHTLKSIVLFLNLIPFIEAGYINFIPDPCGFDSYLHHEMIDMAKTRLGKFEIEKEEKEVLKALQEDDFKRTILMLPDDYQREQIKRALPNLSEEQIEETFKYSQLLKEQDPLTLLQKDAIGPDGGQMLISNMSPNFEISMLLAQITGAVLLTDSPFRWQEISGSQYQSNGVVVNNWSNLTDAISESGYKVNTHSEEAFLLRNSGKFGSVRKALKEIHLAIKEDDSPSDQRVNILTKQLKSSYSSAERQLKEDEFTFEKKLSFLTPKGGIVHNNVQRMLLANGPDKYMDKVAMAVFVEAYEKNNG